MKITRIILDLFEQISSIPRASQHESEIKAWLHSLAISHGFKTKEDQIGNLVIQVPATSGYENKSTIIIQGHLDMVCEKTTTSQHDFTRDPIALKYDGDWLSADQTTLGADNGIGMALGLSLALDQNLKHPELELLFTVQEEIGLIGALELEPGLLNGRSLINLDSDQEGVLICGCAGGNQTRINLPLYDCEQTPKLTTIFELNVSGITGGHSGIDINKGRANANLIMARVLYMLTLENSIRLITLKGGSAFNAIARDASAVFISERDDIQIKKFETIIKNEYKLTEPDLKINMKQIQDYKLITNFSASATLKIIQLILALPHGTAGLITSNNLATIETKSNYLQITTCQRSSLSSALEAITTKVEITAALAGAFTKTDNRFPAWPSNMDSRLLLQAQKAYQELFQKQLMISTIHAGLECGVIQSKYKQMDAVSLGPTSINAHSPNEKLYLPSLIRVWKLLANILQS